MKTSINHKQATRYYVTVYSRGNIIAHFEYRTKKQAEAMAILVCEAMDQHSGGGNCYDAIISKYWMDETDAYETRAFVDFGIVRWDKHHRVLTNN